MADFDLPALDVCKLIATGLLLPTKNDSKPKQVVLDDILDDLYVAQQRIINIKRYKTAER